MNVALLGYGYAGKTLHAPLIRSVRGLHLTAVMSSRAVPDVTVVRSADEVFADPTVDLVVIATPNDTHYDLAHRALAAGKHVVVDSRSLSRPRKPRHSSLRRQQPRVCSRSSTTAVGMRTS